MQVMPATGAQLALDQDGGGIDVFQHEGGMRSGRPKALFDASGHLPACPCGTAAIDDDPLTLRR